jgi:hypothetical protein
MHTALKALMCYLGIPFKQNRVTRGAALVTLLPVLQVCTLHCMPHHCGCKPRTDEARTLSTGYFDLCPTRRCHFTVAALNIELQRNIYRIFLPSLRSQRVQYMGVMT